MVHGDKMSNYIEIKNSRSILVNDSFKNVSLRNVIQTNQCIQSYVYETDHGELRYFCHPPVINGDIVCLAGNSTSFLFYKNSYMSGPSGWDYYAQNTPRGSSDTYFYLFNFQKTSETGGLEVTGADGTQIFNSNLKYLRIIDVIKGHASSINYGIRAYSHKIGIIPVSTVFNAGNENAWVTETDSIFSIGFPTSNSFGFYRIQDKSLVTSPPSSCNREIYVLVVNLDGL